MGTKRAQKVWRRVIAPAVALFCAVTLLAAQGGMAAMAKASVGVSLPISNAATISTQPKDVSVTAGATATFKVVATGTGTLTYQWQLKAPSATAWKDSTSASAKKATFSLTTQAGHNGYQFRCVVKDGSGATTTSGVATLTIEGAATLAITTQPKSTAVNTGSTVSFKVVASGTGLTYQWQTKAPNTTTWKNSTSSTAKKATFSMKTQLAHNGYQFRCVVKDASGKSVTSNAATLKVQEEGTPLIGTQPKNTTVYEGKTATFKIVATGIDPLSYQWQTKAPGATAWKNSTSTSATKATFSMKAQLAHNGYQVRCVVKAANGKSTASLAVKLTVKESEPPVITKQPVGKTAKTGTTAKFTVAATGEGTLTYRWEMKAPTSSTWKDSTASGAATATVSISVKAAHDKYQFRCVVTDSNGRSTTSDAATLKIYNPALDPNAARNLGGRDIVIADWWDNNWEFARGTEAENNYADYQESMMQKHNYTIRYDNRYYWGEQAEVNILAIVSNEPIADIITIDYRFLGGFFQSEPLLLDVSKVPEFDFSDEKWNKSVLDSMSIGSSIYGFSHEFEPTLGIYFNKDLIEQLRGASYRDVLYDWQANGTWTWDKFKTFAKSLTKDTNGDGKTDVYGFCGQQSVFFEMAMLSNGHTIVSKAADGRRVNNATRTSIVNDCNWAYSFYTEGITRRQSEAELNDGMWNYFDYMFAEEKSAMILSFVYRAEEFSAYDFDLGFVCFPKGPNASDYVSVCQQNILAIPNTTETRENLNDIAYAYNIFSDTSRLKEDENYWKTYYVNQFKDSRAINETVNMLVNSCPRVMESSYVVPGLWDNSNGVIQCQILYDLDTALATPDVVLDAANPGIVDALADFNSRIK